MSVRQLNTGGALQPHPTECSAFGPVEVVTEGMNS